MNYLCLRELLEAGAGVIAGDGVAVFTADGLHAPHGASD